VGSNPTPRAILVDLSEINKIKRCKNTVRKTRLSFKQEKHIAEQQNNKKTEYDLLLRKVNSITKSCTKLYFNQILHKLAQENPENANIICDYIIAEETELNIKNSTKESRIKVITWLSEFFFSCFFLFDYFLLIRSLCFYSFLGILMPI
jgi:hypothetical protein